MGEDKVSLNYEAEYNKLLKRIAEMKSEYEERIQTDSEFYEQALKRKDDEISWYKKIIGRILHI